MSKATLLVSSAMGEAREAGGFAMSIDIFSHNAMWIGEQAMRTLEAKGQLQEEAGLLMFSGYFLVNPNTRSPWKTDDLKKVKP